MLSIVNYQEKFGKPFLFYTSNNQSSIHLIAQTEDIHKEVYNFGNVLSDYEFLSKLRLNIDERLVQE